jgi:DNA mismatch endonuclease Vsr
MTYMWRGSTNENVSRRELLFERLIDRTLRPETGRTIYLGDWPKHGSPPRVTPDMTFYSAKVAVFLDGCYWHECPDHKPRSFGGKAQARDKRNNERLAAEGWVVLRLWEHDWDIVTFADQVMAAVRERQAQAA